MCGMVELVTAKEGRVHVIEKLLCHSGEHYLVGKQGANRVARRA
jgi:hypothetical protein